METAIPVAMLGLNNVGKTTLIHATTCNINEIFPTATLEITHITSTSRTLLVYDCSGEGASRANWPLIASMADCVVFVIDVQSKGTFATAKKQLFSFLDKNKFMK